MTDDPDECAEFKESIRPTRRNQWVTGEFKLQTKKLTSWKNQSNDPEDWRTSNPWRYSEINKSSQATRNKSIIFIGWISRGLENAYHHKFVQNSFGPHETIQTADETIEEAGKCMEDHELKESSFEMIGEKNINEHTFNEFRDRLITYPKFGSRRPVISQFIEQILNPANGSKRLYKAKSKESKNSPLTPVERIVASRRRRRDPNSNDWWNWNENHGSHDEPQWWPVKGGFFLIKEFSRMSILEVKLSSRSWFLISVWKLRMNWCIDIIYNKMKWEERTRPKKTN